MTISELILTLPPDTKSLIRSIEKTTRKIINTQLSLVFNKTYIYIYIYCQTETCVISVSFIYIYIYITRNAWEDW